VFTSLLWFFDIAFDSAGHQVSRQSFMNLRMYSRYQKDFLQKGIVSTELCWRREQIHQISDPTEFHQITIWSIIWIQTTTHWWYCYPMQCLPGSRGNIARAGGSH
jgi:hypothetical protein